MSYHPVIRPPNRGWAVLFSLFLASIALVGGALAAEPSPEIRSDKVIPSLQETWTVQGESADVVHRLEATADILYYDFQWKLLWIHSNDVTTFVNAGDKRLPFRSGQRVHVEGEFKFVEGLNADRIKVTVVGAVDPDLAKPITFTTAEINDLGSKQVVFEGIVQKQIEVDPNHYLLDVVVHGRMVRVNVWMELHSPVPQLEGNMARFVGLAAVTRKVADSEPDLNVWLPNFQHVTHLYPASADSRFAQARPIQIDQWDQLPPDATVRVSGVVQSISRGQGFIVRDETGQVFVRTEQRVNLAQGQGVEAVGMARREEMDFVLLTPIFRASSAAATQAASADVLMRLRMADQVLGLMPAEAARGHPVRLQGIVLWSDPKSTFFFIADSSGGVRVQVNPDVQVPSAGSSVTVHGRTATGPFAPVVNATSITNLGNPGLPKGRRITVEQALTGVEEAQWVEMRGYIRDVVEVGHGAMLYVTAPGGEFVVFSPTEPQLRELKGCLVSVRGVCVVLANERRQMVGVELWSPSMECIQVEERAPADVFTLPGQSIASLREYSSMQAGGRRVRVTGVVLHHAPGRYLYLQEGGEGIQVLSRINDQVLEPGDRIDVVGFLGRENSRSLVRDAVFRKQGTDVEPVPTPLAVGQKVNPDLDVRLVRATATLLDLVIRRDHVVLLLQAGPVLFEAKYDTADASVMQLLKSGSRVAVTGVYRTELDEYHSPVGFHLQLRRPQDVVVLRSPSWWTTDRALSVAGVCGAVAFLGLAWNTLLRRRVRQQTQQIRMQMDKEMSLEARYRDLVEKASDFIFSVDAAGRFTSFNPAGERIFGYTKAEALKMNLRDLLAAEDAESVEFLNESARAGVTITTQNRFLTRDGRMIWFEINARHTVSPTGDEMVLAVGRDISERKQIEEELKKARDAAEANTRAKSAFLANMSHEIRTPMNGVIGMSNLLLDTSLSESQRDFAETIRNSADALLTVLNDILDFSKIEAGKLHFETLDFNLRDTVDETIELLAARAASKSLELAAFVPTDVPCFLRGDSGRLRQVILNLLGNAVKFTERGEVVIHVHCDEKSDRHVKLRFEVTDTGIGMSTDAQAKLFQPFSQADSSTTRKFGGTGLGLAISKQIVELMGGEIGLRSTLGEGSTFWFTVHLERQPDRPSRAPLAPADMLRGRRTLVVDDNLTNRRIMAHYLSAWNMTCDEALDGSSALEKLRQAVGAGNPFHVVVLDFEMPGMDGMMLAREINADPALSGTRMVLCTSWDSRFNRDEMDKIGVAQVILKPIRQPELLMSLLQALSEEIEAEPEASVVRDPSRSPQPIAATSSSLKLLIAEDNIVNQRVTMLQLQKLGYRADLATTGVEVLDALERTKYDAILMDCHMPEMDGYEATRRIRQNPRIAGIKIIAMTANAMQGDREKCLSVGMDDYVSKPTRLSDLQDAILRNTAVTV